MKQLYVLFIVVAFGTLKLQGQHKAGTLDSSFGTNGTVVFSNLTPRFSCYDAARQSDGKIICAGSSFTVMRANTDGSIDTSFGDNGAFVLISDYTTRAGNAITVQSDDRILVTGYGVKGFVDPNYDIVTIRLQANGDLDSSFGLNGVAVFDYDDNDFGRDIIVQPDQKILVQASGGSNFITLRYLSNGTLDEEFGDGGKAITMFTSLVTAYAIALQADGKIVTSGTSSSRVILTRHLADGAIDASFGSNGKVSSGFGGTYNIAKDVIVQPDGKIVIVGYLSNFLTNKFLLARYNGDGSLDASFGHNGSIIPQFDYTSTGWRIALQNDSKIVASGFTGGGSDTDQRYLLLRFQNNGSLDSLFATNGQAQTSILDFDVAYGLVLSQDNIILAGVSTGGGNSYPSLAQYHNDDLTKKQILIAKIRRWLQHHNGIAWDNMPGAKSYAVQRSSNGLNWSTIFRSPLTAHRSPLTNSYADPSPLPGTNYYRLQTTSVDGAVAYSNVIAISNELSVISISPNPARSVLRIEGLPSSGKTKITVADFAGNVVISNQLSAASSSFNLNVVSIKPGNYLLRIETEGEVITRQFVKE